jgi:hypothetical protein
MGRFFKLQALARVILSQTRPDVRLYVLPLQIHPLHSPWRYATPGSFVKSVWKAFGPFLTLGWPQDTTGLEEGCMTDAAFLALCDSIFDARERILMHQIEAFDEGILASVFDSMDRVQHMFLRDRPDIVEAWYEKLDALVGRVEQRLAERKKGGVRLIVVSDHGFSGFDFKVHLNRWLIDRDYLVKNGNGAGDSLKHVDWANSKAYAVGLNSLYVNLAGREGQGSVQPQEYPALVKEIQDGLLKWRASNGQPVVQRPLSREQAFSGQLATYGPDIVVGFAPGYRASSETGLGQWGETVILPNGDHWGADHCVDACAVPGVLFCNQGLSNYPDPSFRDFPALAIGSALDSGDAAPPPSFSKEDQETIEERLRSLGYL